MSGHMICNNVLVDIFARLPPKSIIRFRSLSKYWRSRLLSAEFLDHHRFRRSKNPPKVLIRHLAYCDRDYEFKDIYTLQSGDQLPLDPGPGYDDIPGVNFPYSIRTTKVVGSCNGILCLRDKEVISLWNVSIRRKLILPRHPCLNFCLKSRGIALGFGYDPIGDDYKVVGISYNEHCTFIYSLKTDSWSDIHSSFTLPSNHKLSKACFFNGILHWDLVVAMNNSYYIVTFNLGTHVFGHIGIPFNWKIRQLTTIDGCLAVVSRENDGTWMIWVMKEYNNVESWCVLFEFKVEVFDVVRVFEHVTNGDMLVYYDGSWVHNLQTGLLTKVLNFGPDCFDLEMERYAESLELLDNERATTCGETIFSWTDEDADEDEDDHKRIRLSQKSFQPIKSFHISHRVEPSQKI